MLKKPTGVKSDSSQAKFTVIYGHDSPASLPDVSAGVRQHWWMNQNYEN
jgi:hypothetical protein